MKTEIRHDVKSRNDFSHSPSVFGHDNHWKRIDDNVWLMFFNQLVQPFISHFEINIKLPFIVNFIDSIVEKAIKLFAD